MSRMDAAKACATLGACRKRSVKPDTDEGIAQRHNLAEKPGFAGRRRLSALRRARATR
ncbi:hypothetical protein Pcaca04_07260 [Pectobacterium carotovorum subsp. carotovorum]|nr:hypothetical protein Pcaca04_07260 [Pectobacterium carotovorum subsp. carotovorum]